MKKRPKRKTSLPRLTLLSYSRQELQRFSEAAEQIVALAHTMVGLMTRLDFQVTRLEKRSAAARKANQTRQQGNGTAELQPPDAE